MSISEMNGRESWAHYEPAKRDKKALALIELSTRAQFERILAFAPKDHRIHWQVRMLFDQFGGYIDAREKEAAVSRLAGLRQHGPKSNRDKIGFAFPVNRFHHSRMVAVNATVFALCAGREVREAIEAFEGGWRHDGMHPAYCHIAEELITKPPFRVDSHEDRSIYWTLDDDPLKRFVLERGLSLGNIVKAMLERGAFPTQSLADTAGYTEHDGHFIGEPVGDDYIWRIAASIKGAEAGRLVVDDTAPIMEMLQRRARYHQVFYNSLHGRVIDSACRRLLFHALTEKFLSIQDVTHSVDSVVDDCFLAMLHGTLRVPRWIQSLLLVARGDKKELKRWREYRLETKEAYEAKLLELTGWRKDVLPVAARDYASKRVRVVNSAGMEQVLQASVQTTDIDRSWFIYTFEQE